MIGGAAGMAACLLIIGGCLSHAPMGTVSTEAIVATVFIFGYNAAFAIGWLGTTWVCYPCYFS